MLGWARGIVALGLALATGAIAPAWAEGRSGTTERVSVGRNGAQANGGSFDPSISADGRYVAFVSGATNLVRRDTNGTTDVFVRDLATGRTERASVGRGGAQAKGGSFLSSISADGRYVAFVRKTITCIDFDLCVGPVDVFVRDRRTGRTELVSVGRGGAQAKGSSSGPSISADGRYIAFVSDASNLVPGDTDGEFDVFVRRR